MTEAAAAPVLSPGPDWEKVKIVYLPKNRKTIRIIGKDNINSEYAGEHLDLTPYQTSDMVEVKIYAGKITDIRFPPGMEPVTTPPTSAPLHTSALAAKTETPAPAKQEPIRDISGDVVLITASGIRIGSTGTYFINDVSLTGIKEGMAVKAKVCGQLLIAIEPAPVAPAELRNGHGPIKVLDLNKPYLSYEYFFKDKNIGAPTSGIQEFSQFTDVAKAKLSQFKVGDKIAVQFSGRGSTAVLHDIGPDIKKPWGGGKPSDPVADAKRQKMIVKQSSLERAVSLWLNGNPGKVPTDADDEIILTRMEKYAERVMRE